MLYLGGRRSLSLHPDHVGRPRHLRRRRRGLSDDDKRDALLARKIEMLRRKLHRLLPKLDTRVEFAWAGAFGETTTGLPIIGQVPAMPRCWIALGYGGNGTTYAAIAADVIAGAITGRPDVDADLYCFPAHDTADLSIVLQIALKRWHR